MDSIMETQKKATMFSKDFILVIIGQIISLFGNAIIRFALPLYLLNQTGSAALFGMVSACSFIPMIILCPIGGIIADRINKRNIMVILDFSTAFITLLLTILLGKVDVVVLLLTAMILYYGIQGAYQPAVQASIPILVDPEYIMPANASITLVSSLSSLLGPVVGGALFAFFGITPILYVGTICFLASAIMEIFIHIPFTKQQSSGNIFSIGFNDMKHSFHFIKHDQPYIFKVSLIIAAINMFLSASVIIGLPIIVTRFLGFEATRANQLYGYAEGAIAAGSLFGGLLAGVLSKKLKAKHSPILLLLCTFTVLPLALSLQFISTPFISYIIILISCFFMMILAALFSIQMMSYLQIMTPEPLIGKVISCAMCIGMCAQPLGQLLFGGLFQWFRKCPYIPFYFAAVVTTIICILSRSLYKNMDAMLMEKQQ